VAYEDGENWGYLGCDRNYCDCFCRLHWKWNRCYDMERLEVCNVKTVCENGGMRRNEFIGHSYSRM